MLPVILDATRLDLLLIGRGPALARRLEWLLEAGASRLTVCTDEPARIGTGVPVNVLPRLPGPAELQRAQVVWITGLDAATSTQLAGQASASGTIVNVEDVLPLCDFHTPAVLRRGELLLTVSTGGKSPGLAQAIRSWLDDRFTAEWAGRLETLARKRTAWRRRPRSLPELAALTKATIDYKGWLAAAGRNAGTPR